MGAELVNKWTSGRAGASMEASLAWECLGAFKGAERRKAELTGYCRCRGEVRFRDSGGRGVVRGFGSKTLSRPDMLRVAGMLKEEPEGAV